MPAILEDAQNGLSDTNRALFSRLLSHFRELHRQVHELGAQIQRWHGEHSDSQRLEKIPGIGPLTASAPLDPAASGQR